MEFFISVAISVCRIQTANLKVWLIVVDELLMSDPERDHGVYKESFLDIHTCVYLGTSKLLVSRSELEQLT